MEQNNLTTQPNLPVPLAKPMFIGSGIGLMLISFFVFGGESNPEWGKLWMIKPLIMAPVAGAMGGAFYYIMELASRGGLNKNVAIVLSLTVFIIGLWMGIVLGLNGTMWD